MQGQPPLTVHAAVLREHAPQVVDVKWQRGEQVERGRFIGVRMESLLSLAGVPQDRSLRGPWLRGRVTAIAADGYRVVFGLGELSTGLTGRQAIVAWERDGSALGDKEGPLRLVIEGDSRPSRSVRQLVALLIDLDDVRAAVPTQ